MHTELICAPCYVQKKDFLVQNLSRPLQAMDVFCVGLVFSRDQLRYHSYARQYVEALLRLQKQVAIFSPNWIELNQYFQINFRDQAKRIHCFALNEYSDLNEQEGKIAFFIRHIKLRRVIKNAERRMNTQIDFLFFAPVDDWIRPAFPKFLLNLVLKNAWSGLLINMANYGNLQDLEKAPMLPLNVDPKFKEPDYLLSSENCKGVCTLDRFRSEQLKSRVYKKVVVLPDVSNYKLPTTLPLLVNQIKKMAKGRMIVGNILLENEEVTHFTDLALQANTDHYFFVCAGAISPQHLSASAQESLSNLLSSGKQNNHFILDNLDDYEQVNALVKCFDVCYVMASKQSIPHALLSKAAFFNKPVIGVSQELTGKLISTFKLGMVVTTELSESMQVLQTYRLQMPLDQNFNNSSLQNYTQLQNQLHLRDAWEMLLWF
jgi:hypothetical protein